MSANFSVGDIVRCNYDGAGDGVIYRVVELGGSNLVRIKPIFACFPDMCVKRRKVRDMGAGWCTKLDVGDLQAVHRELEALIGGEMNRDYNINPMAHEARVMGETRKTVDDGDTFRCEGDGQQPLRVPRRYQREGWK